MTDKKEIVVGIDDLESIVDAYCVAQSHMKELSVKLKEWDAVAKTLKAELVNTLQERAGDADIYIGTVNKKKRVRFTVFDQDVFQKDKFGEQYPDLLEEFTIKIPGRSSRFTVK